MGLSVGKLECSHFKHILDKGVVSNMFWKKPPFLLYLWHSHNPNQALCMQKILENPQLMCDRNCYPADSVGTLNPIPRSL